MMKIQTHILAILAIGLGMGSVLAAAGAGVATTVRDVPGVTRAAVKYHGGAAAEAGENRPAPAAVVTTVLFTKDTEGITNLLERADWANSDEREGTVFDKTRRKTRYGYGIGAWNLGAMTEIATWPVKDFTGYDPPQPYDQNLNQLSPSNTYGESAVQASGLNWGAYVNGADWQAGDRATYRYFYHFENPPSLGGENFIRMLVEAHIAVPLYKGSAKGGGEPIGWGVTALLFRNLSTGNFLTFNLKFFDPRGFKHPNGEWKREKTGRLPIGDRISVGSYYGPNTLYCRQLPGSSDSRDSTWGEKTYFGVEIIPAHFAKIIDDANRLMERLEDPRPRYSTALDDWILAGTSVGVEMTWLNDSFAMSYIGDTFRISAEYEK